MPKAEIAEMVGTFEAPEMLTRETAEGAEDAEAWAVVGVSVVRPKRKAEILKS